MKKFLLIMICFTMFYGVKAQLGHIKHIGPGKVILKNGTEITGRVEYYLDSPSRVRVLNDKTNEGEKFKPVEVNDFTVNDLHYFSIEAKDGASIGKDGTFGRILNSVDSKIKLFICETQSIITVGEAPPVEKVYYAIVPGDNAAYALTSMQFTPFKKVAKIVSDCPELAKKIESKEKGFTYPMITTDEFRLEIFLKVAEAYQNCK